MPAHTLPLSSGITTTVVDPDEDGSSLKHYNFNSAMEFTSASLHLKYLIDSICNNCFLRVRFVKNIQDVDISLNQLDSKFICLLTGRHRIHPQIEICLYSFLTSIEQYFFPHLSVCLYGARHP